jgi:hypothetical protein
MSSVKGGNGKFKRFTPEELAATTREQTRRR